MATVVSHAIGAGSTSNADTYASASFTPVAGSLLVVATVAGATANNLGCVASANGITFTKAIQLASDTGLDRTALFVADQLVPGSPSSMTVTVDCATGDSANGACIEVGYITGMTLTGASAIRQTAGTDNNLTISSTPTVTFGVAPVSTNPVIGAVSNNDSPANQTPPPSFAEMFDGGYSTPTSGFEVVSIDSGAPTTLTWGSTSSRGAVFAVEFDASAPATGGRGPRPRTVLQAVSHAATW